MFDLGTHFRLGAFPLDLIDNTTVTIAAIGESSALGACSRITTRWPRYAWSPHTRVSLPCNRSGSTVLSATLAGVAWTAWISLRLVDPDRRAAIARLRIERLDQREQRRPRHNPLHLGQKDCPPVVLA
jgi:hypothetical protein